jgi:hypothetical protein
MNFKVNRVDLEKTKSNWPSDKPFAPAYIEPRGKTDKNNWYVLAEPFEPGEKPVWYQTISDEYIRIPLFPYVLHAEADLAFAFMLQIGLACAGELPRNISCLHIVTGVPVEIASDGEDKHLDYWFGFAVVVDNAEGGNE